MNKQQAAELLYAIPENASDNDKEMLQMFQRVFIKGLETCEAHQSGAAPQGGLVWVKANKEVLPLPGVDVVIRYQDGIKKEIIVGSRHAVITLIERGYTDIEFLSESTNPLTCTV